MNTEIIDDVDTSECAQIPEIELSDQQREAIEFAVKEMQRPYSIIKISGPAGSGKTTTMKNLVDRLSEFGPVIVSAMTNKAKLVLNQKGVDAVTMHQACMKPLFKPPLNKLAKYIDESKGAITMGSAVPKPPMDLLNSYTESELAAAVQTTIQHGIYSALRGLGIKDVFKYLDRWLPAERQEGVLIVDEASMMSADNLKTASAVFRKIILVGDEFQLPPPGNEDEAVFWKVSTGFALTEIHRQAEGSQPLRIATEIRVDGTTDPDPVVPIDFELCRAGVPIITWRNVARIKHTNAIRKALGFDGLPPQPGEWLICRNGSDRDAKNRGLINNTMWKVVESNAFRATLENDAGDILENESLHMEELDEGYGVPFRFAYAITAHNSQGSEWPQVMIDEPETRKHFSAFRESAPQWLYTAVTRAKELVIWVK